MFVAQILLLAVVCVSLRATPTPEPQLSSSSSSSSSDTPHSSISISTDEAERLNVSTHTLSTGDLLTSTAHPSSSSGDTTSTPESWTHQQHTESVSAVSSEDFGTDATMSSEDLPLIFEPFEDVTPAGASVSTSISPAEPTEAEHTASDSQRSTSDPPDTTLGDDVTLSSITHQNLSVVQLPASKPKSASEYQESREEPDEDEEDEELDSEEEEESEEDLSESTITPHTRPPYSLIPPPPVWVQRNQGLVRSWVELIREKAGYVSGMLAPVGIGIAGALLLVGALYSIRLIHRKRRESFKHQRRKPPREVQSGPDNTMLLADSSEDEF
ncbi:armadillo-like helical domain-containing protein 4 isoform X2 [Danio aesculapii]|uniref:armadillo-like helical domain-containing protein 4 isoform X2 n=1 Tax=Danio aesculapii TaxID=1142201 RepID=UPI0024C0891A|nr:armadillo-like helical domain-containing protein 4 isoform X2 [Danio aesculapii]